MANEKLCVATESSPKSLWRALYRGALHFAVGLDIQKFEKHLCFIVLHIFWAWSFVSEGLNPLKTLSRA